MTDCVGFTGTRNGMTSQQHKAVRELLSEFNPDHVRHGDCVGADAQFHILARDLFLYIIIHPPIDPKHRAWCTGDELMPKKHYLKRNRDIVNGSDIVIATPKGEFEEPRGGTWSTIRWARAMSKPCLIVYPDGSVSPRHR